MDRRLPDLADDLPVTPRRAAAPKRKPGAGEKRDPKTGQFVSADDAHTMLKPGEVRDLGGGRTAIKMVTQNGKFVDRHVNKIVHALAGKHGVGMRQERVGQSMIENLNHHTVAGKHNKVAAFHEDFQKALKMLKANDFDGINQLISEKPK